jgi:hypothetical protein
VAQAGAKGKRMRFLCIFGIPRTGSMHLCKLLRSCPEFNVKPELFHGDRRTPITIREMAALRERSGGAVTDMDSFIAWRRTHVFDTLEALHEGGRGRIVTVKMFPGHGSRKAMETELLPRADVACALLARRPIDSYISNLKAKTLDAYGSVDTTDLKPALSADDFLGWARVTKRWYAHVEGRLEARGAPYARISYERILEDRPDADTLRDVLALLAPLGLTGIAVPPTIKGGQRQDKERRYRDRIANWYGFKAAVQADPEGAELLEWARKVPWADA